MVEINAEFNRVSSVTGMLTDLLVVIKGQCSDSATEGAVEEGGGDNKLFTEVGID